MLAVLSIALPIKCDGQHKWQSTQFHFAPAAFAGYSHTATTEIRIFWPVENALLCFTSEWLAKAKTRCAGILIGVQHGTLWTHLWTAEQSPTASATPEEQSLYSTPGLNTFWPYPVSSSYTHSPTCLEVLHWVRKHKSWNLFRKALLTSFLRKCLFLLPVQEKLLPILQTINITSNSSSSADATVIQAKCLTYNFSKERRVVQLLLKNPCTKPGESEQSFYSLRIIVKILKESQQTPTTM